MSEIILIAAVAANNVIGQNGELPWRISEDMKRFKDLTMGHPVIMGRKTYESIFERLRKPLPGRRNIVLSTREDYRLDGVEVVGSLEDALALVERNPRLEFEENSIYVIGGASVYAAAMSFASKLEITQIDKSYIGDVYFPMVDKSLWTEMIRLDKWNDLDKYSFVTYGRR